MKHDEFVSQVRELETSDEAERAIRATFETLRERLGGNEPNNLADQLPGELAAPLRGEGVRDSFSLAEFYRRVGEKEGVEEPEAIRHARTVTAILQVAVTTGEMDDVRDQLKPEYVELFIGDHQPLVVPGAAHPEQLAQPLKTGIRGCSLIAPSTMACLRPSGIS